MPWEQNGVPQERYRVPWGLGGRGRYLLLLGLHQQVPGQLLLAVLAQSRLLLFLLLLFLLHHVPSRCPGSGVLGELPRLQESPVAAGVLLGGPAPGSAPGAPPVSTVPGLGSPGTPAHPAPRPYLEPCQPGKRKAEVRGGPAPRNAPLQPPALSAHPAGASGASSPCSPRCRRICLAGSAGRSRASKSGDGGTVPASPGTPPAPPAFPTPPAPAGVPRPRWHPHPTACAPCARAAGPAASPRGPGTGRALRGQGHP